MAERALKVIEKDEPGETPAPSLRMARRIAQIDLPEPYEDFHVTAWMNHPQRIQRDLASQDEERTYGALMEVVVGHNIVDFDGVPFPPANTREFWDEIPLEVMRVIITEVMGNVGKLPKASAGS